MIRHIVALDSKRGIAKGGFMPPWHLKYDEAYFNEQTMLDGGNVLMGNRTFIEALRLRPLKNRVNYIVTHDVTPITGAVVVNDLAAFMSAWPKDKTLWIIGGSEIFAQTLDTADELYVTEIEGDFHCDRFYPDYKQSFRLLHTSAMQEEHNVQYRFCIYGR